MPLGQILIIDDESKLRNLYKRIISLEGFIVYEASDLRSANRIMQREMIDVILCDVHLPDGSGVEFIKRLKTEYSGVELILITAFGNVSEGIQAMKNGAFDYLTKGDDNDKIIPLINKAFEKVCLQKRLNKLEKEVKVAFSFQNIIGKSSLIEETISLAKKIAPSNTSVLLLGETGTGKELFARAIHTNSGRATKPFVAINCSAFSKDLLESELFGYKAGAFTGAIKDKTGLMEEANGGTLFLDEVGEMDFDIQAKFLRVLEVSEFIKLGDTKTSSVDIRLISAANKNLYEEVQAGRFREDLFYRINVFTLRLPSLIERKSDIPLLAKYYMDIYAKKLNKNINEMNKEFIDKLKHHIWPGNIRELKNVIERAVIMSDSPILTELQLPVDIHPAKTNINSSIENYSTLDLESIEKKHIQRVLNLTKGNKVEAARLLKIGVATLYRKIENYDLSLINISNDLKNPHI